MIRLRGCRCLQDRRRFAGRLLAFALDGFLFAGCPLRCLALALCQLFRGWALIGVIVLPAAGLRFMEQGANSHAAVRLDASPYVPRIAVFVGLRLLAPAVPQVKTGIAQL